MVANQQRTADERWKTEGAIQREGWERVRWEVNVLHLIYSAYHASNITANVHNYCKCWISPYFKHVKVISTLNLGMWQKWERDQPNNLCNINNAFIILQSEDGGCDPKGDDLQHNLIPNSKKDTIPAVYLCVWKEDSIWKLLRDFSVFILLSSLAFLYTP